MLRRIDPDILFGETGKTVGERLTEIRAEMQEVRLAGREAENLLNGQSEQVIGQYADDVSTLGWRKALEILRAKANNQSQ